MIQRAKMDPKRAQRNGETLSCSVCLDLLKDPATLPCGHSYCTSCIQNYWDDENHWGTHRCPQCRSIFNPRPVLKKTVMLVKLVEELKRTDGEEHRQEDICPRHKEEMKNFCRSDRLNNCYICLTKEQWSHKEAQIAKNNRCKLFELERVRQENISLWTYFTFVCVCLAISVVFNVPLIVQVIQLPEPEAKSREDFLKYSVELTLDPNTAHPRLLLSEENKKATFTFTSNHHHDHPDRFNYWTQVLSKEKLWGRQYWEVEWAGGAVDVAVAYENIQSGFGHDDKSWALYCDKTSFVFHHKGVQTALSGPVSSRVGVYLDHGAGVLAFYSVSETMTLLHRVQTTFTRPLHAGLRFYDYFLYTGGDSAEFIQLRGTA